MCARRPQLSKYTDTVRRVAASLQATARTLALTDDLQEQRQAMGELAKWLRVLGFKADSRLDHIRVFGQELFFADCLWQYNGAVGSRNVAVELATLTEEEAPRKGDDQLTPYAWVDGTRLTKGELRAWLRA